MLKQENSVDVGASRCFYYNLEVFDEFKMVIKAKLVDQQGRDNQEVVNKSCTDEYGYSDTIARENMRYWYYRCLSCI